MTARFLHVFKDAIYGTSFFKFIMFKYIQELEGNKWVPKTMEEDRTNQEKLKTELAFAIDTGAVNGTRYFTQLI